MMLAGCSLPLDSTLANNNADVEQTGSTPPRDRAGPSVGASSPAEADLAYARAVAADALARDVRDASTPWENPRSGAGGNITPLAGSYTNGDLFCRDFLASYVHGQSQAWLQGEACRTEQGKWQVKSLKPLRQG
jgi:surface antigen